jgi:hypothetical protein
MNVIELFELFHAAAEEGLDEPELAAKWSAALWALKEALEPQHEKLERLHAVLSNALGVTTGIDAAMRSQEAMSEYLLSPYGSVEGSYPRVLRLRFVADDLRDLVWASGFSHDVGAGVPPAELVEGELVPREALKNEWKRHEARKMFLEEWHRDVIEENGERAKRRIEKVLGDEARLGPDPELLRGASPEEAELFRETHHLVRTGWKDAARCPFLIGEEISSRLGDVPLEDLSFLLPSLVHEERILCKPVKVRYTFREDPTSIPEGTVEGFAIAHREDKPMMMRTEKAGDSSHAAEAELFVFKKHGRIWQVTFQGNSAPVEDSIGMGWYERKRLEPRPCDRTRMVPPPIQRSSGATRHLGRKDETIRDLPDAGSHRCGNGKPPARQDRRRLLRVRPPSLRS